MLSASHIVIGALLRVAVASTSSVSGTSASIQRSGYRIFAARYVHRFRAATTVGFVRAAVCGSD